MYGAGLAIENRAGVAAGVQAVIPDYFEIAPGRAAIGAASHDQVNVAGVATAVASTFSEGQQGLILSGDEGGNPKGVIALGSAFEEILHLGSGQ